MWENITAVPLLLSHSKTGGRSFSTCLHESVHVRPYFTFVRLKIICFKILYEILSDENKSLFPRESRQFGKL